MNSNMSNSWLGKQHELYDMYHLSFSLQVIVLIWKCKRFVYGILKYKDYLYDLKVSRGKISGNSKNRVISCVIQKAPDCSKLICILGKLTVSNHKWMGFVYISVCNNVTYSPFLFSPEYNMERTQRLCLFCWMMQTQYRKIYTVLHRAPSCFLFIAATAGTDWLFMSATQLIGPKTPVPDRLCLLWGLLSVFIVLWSHM